MVYVVVLRGTPQVLDAARQQLVGLANGWELLAENVYLIGQAEAHPEALRNFIRRQPGIEVVVMGLSGAWASGGCANLAAWLRAAQNMF